MKIRNILILSILLSALFVGISCGKPNFDKSFSNTYLSFKYPPILEIDDSEPSDIKLLEIGKKWSMMTFQIRTFEGLTEGNTHLVDQKFLTKIRTLPEAEVKLVRVDNVKSLFVKAATPGGVMGGDIVEILQYFIPLDNKVLLVELTPQIKEDIELGHKIVKTLEFK